MRFRFRFTVPRKIIFNYLGVSAYIFAIEQPIRKSTNSKQDVSFSAGTRYRFAFRAKDKQIGGQIDPLRQVRLLTLARRHVHILHFLNML